MGIIKILCPNIDSINNDTIFDVTKFPSLQLSMKTAMKSLENEKIVDRIAKLYVYIMFMYIDGYPFCL